MLYLKRGALLAAGATALAWMPSVSAQNAASIVAPDDLNAMTLAQSWEVLQVTPPPITNTVIVEGPLENAWALWTDPARMPEFMGFAAEIDPQPGGIYRAIFVPQADTPLGRGNDGRVIAVEDRKMLSFTWMTPMHMSGLSGNSTFVTLHFTPLEGGKRTQVDLINVGYGTSEEWREAYVYNVRGWDRVLTHFQYAMEVGPIDWVQRAKDLKRDKTLPMWREYQRKVLKGEDPLARSDPAD